LDDKGAILEEEEGTIHPLLMVPNDGTISISTDPGILSLGRVIVTQIYR
jgi:hypothetical protein